MADLMVFGSNPDGIWLRLLGGDRAARILTKFVEGVVGQCLSIEAREGCRGQMFAIEAVYEFLFIVCTMAEKIEVWDAAVDELRKEFGGVVKDDRHRIPSR
ncbi:hypothetical protein DVH05_006923 [Phytophthora capsici]|nr:hypothetical protein DVH05_006923 [Phytophthora capsici]